VIQMTNDLISRQAAIDALEKVAELYPWRVPGNRDSYSQYNEAWQDALNRADSEIEALPSAQPHITHCAECIHWQHSAVRKSYCEVFDWMNKAEDFCSFAERRTDE